MARGSLTKEEMEILRQNKYVSYVEEKQITYTNEFKFHFIQEYINGKKPTQIFVDAGFDPQILGSKRIERAAYRWKKSYMAGTLGKYDTGYNQRKRDEEIEKIQKRFGYRHYLEHLGTLYEEIENLKEENKVLREKIIVITEKIESS